MAKIRIAIVAALVLSSASVALARPTAPDADQGRFIIACGTGNTACMAPGP